MNDQTKQQTPDAPQAAPPEAAHTPAGSNEAAPVPPDLDDIARAELQAHADDFLSDAPADMRDGSYGAHVRDRWHGELHAIPDGTWECQGMLWTFNGGVFIGVTTLPPYPAAVEGDQSGDPLGR